MACTLRSSLLGPTWASHHGATWTLASAMQTLLVHRATRVVMLCGPPACAALLVAPSLALQLGEVSFLVLDEADRMVDPGRFQELRSILALLPPRPKAGDSAASGPLQAAHPKRGRESKGERHGAGTHSKTSPAQGPVPRKRQVLVFSATLAVAQALHGRLCKTAPGAPPGAGAGAVAVGRRPEMGPGREGAHAGASGALDFPSTDSLVALTGLSPSAALVDFTPERIVASKVAEAAVE